jgi:hypothetical protein
MALPTSLEIKDILTKKNKNKQAHIESKRNAIYEENRLKGVNDIKDLE